MQSAYQQERAVYVECSLAVCVLGLGPAPLPPNSPLRLTCVHQQDRGHSQDAHQGSPAPASSRQTVQQCSAWHHHQPSSVAGQQLLATSRLAARTCCLPFSASVLSPPPLTWSCAGLHPPGRPKSGTRCCGTHERCKAVPQAEAMAMAAQWLQAAGPEQAWGSRSQPPPPPPLPMPNTPIGALTRSGGR